MDYLLASYRRLLSNNSFLLFVFASLFSGMGTIIGSIGRDVLVLDLTDTGKTLLGLGILLQIPTILLGPVSGVVSDHFNRKIVVVIGRLLLGGLVLLFCFTHSYLVIMILVIIFVSITTFTNPASQSMIPELVDKQDLIHSNSMISLVGTLVAIFGASVANITISNIGVRATFVVDSFTFFVGAVVIWRMRYDSVVVPPQKRQVTSVVNAFRSIGESLRAGMAYLRSNRVVLMIVLLTVSVTFCACIINSLLVAMVSKELNGSYANYAELLVWGPVGYLLGTLIVGPMKTILDERLLLCLGLLLAGGCLVIFSLLTEITYARYLFIPLYVGNAFFFISKDTLIQSLTDNMYLGRVLVFSSILASVASIVVLSVATALYDFVGLRNLYLGASVAVALLGLSAGMLFLIKR